MYRKKINIRQESTKNPHVKNPPTRHKYKEIKIMYRNIYKMRKCV